MPLVLPLNVQFLTSRLFTPPPVLLPMDRPWPCKNTQSLTVMSSLANSRPATLWLDLMATLSSPTSMRHRVIRTFLHELGSIASVLGERGGAMMVTFETTTPSHSVGTKWNLGEFCSVRFSRRTFLQPVSIIKFGRGSV